MNARHGKIARLPLAIREELNRRLQSGQLSPALLPWLNQLPETNTILAEHFASQPISRQNLSEWRLGGYRDWLKLQERELLIRRLAEEGTSLKKQEGEDLFESFARIAAAELFADLNALDELHGEKRWQRLRSLTRELASLQREYNRSRQVELAWEKWNDQFEIAPIEENPKSKNSSAIPLQAEHPTAGLSQNLVDDLRVPKLHPLPGGLELLGKQRKESAEGGGPLRAERAGASESLGRGEGGSGTNNPPTSWIFS